MQRSSYQLPAAMLLVLSVSMAATAPLALGEDAGSASSGDGSPAELWSLKPLPPLSAFNANDSVNGSQPIDGYIQRGLERGQLAVARRAEPHQQVRRLCLLLTGLPPDPATVKWFVTDPSDENYTRLVEQYLDSPRFGERWARHWMDVVRFAETWGYEWNFLVRDAWRYRDYLIRAFNADVPYDQLIREHVAGDLLAEPRQNHELDINESLIGTAFYRFGEMGHDDCTIYPEISLDVLDNQLDTLFKTFQALTVSCARCHDHKLDAIPQQDYYAMLGVLASSRQVMHTIDLPDHQGRLKRQLLATKRELRRELGRLWLSQVDKITVATLDAAVAALTGAEGDGDSSAATATPRIEHPLFAWQQMSQAHADTDWANRWEAVGQQIETEHHRRVGFNRAHFTVFADFAAGAPSGWAIAGAAAEHGFARDGDFVVRHQGETIVDRVLPAGFYSHLISQKLNATVRSPLLPLHHTGIVYEVVGQGDPACRTIIDNCQLAYFHTNWFKQPDWGWLRSQAPENGRYRAYFEWTTRFDNQAYPNLSTPDAEYRQALENPRSYFGLTRVLLSDSDHVPLPELAAQQRLTQSTVSGPPELAARYREFLRAAVSAWQTDQATPADVYWINAFLAQQTLSRRCDASPLLAELVDNYRALEARLELPRMIVGMADQGPGFDLPVFTAGDPRQPAAVATRAYLSCLSDAIAPDTTWQGSGRAAVAAHIADPANPLTARVMANRIWHYLFATGIVKSVDDFGSIGDRPSHPRLLDYLARRFIDSGWSIKSLIREIVLSDVFRQASEIDPKASQIDPENRLLHHFPARRLEAEAIRDSLLAVSGQIDLTMYGPSIQPYRTEEVESRRLFSGPLDGARRRSLYISVTRMGPSKLLSLFNLPAPGSTVGRRDSTNVPAQALGMLNHPFVHQQARCHAERLLASGDQEFHRHVDTLFMTLFGRRPTLTELGSCETLFAQLAEVAAASLAEPVPPREDVSVWKEFIHALYNLKEFTYVL